MWDDEPFRYTEAEAAMLARLAQVRVAADSGNRKAKQQIAKVARQLATLRKRARKGDKRAARSVRVLEESGLLAPSQVFAMEGWLPENSWIRPVISIGLMALTGALLYKYVVVRE